MLNGKDVSGNESGQSTLTVANIDKIAPAVTASNGAVTSSSVNVIATASDTGGSSLNTASYQYSKDNGVTWTTASSATNYTFNTLTAGTYQCKVKVADKAGNFAISNATAITTGTLGIATLVASTTAWTNGNVTVTITYPTGIVTKQYSTNGTTWNTYSTPVVVSVNNTTIYARGIDAGSNQTAQATLTVANIDKIVPTVTASDGGTTSSSLTIISNASDTGGSGIATTGYQYSKDNGTTWTAATSETSYTFTGLTSTSYQCKVKVTDAAGNVATSSAINIGLTGVWCTQTVGTNNYLDIAYNNGRWVAIGNSGALAYSDNGLSWTTVSLTTKSISKIAYNNGMWVASGYDGFLAYSTNGSTWNIVSINTNHFLIGLSYVGGAWYAVGSVGSPSSSTSTGVIYRSTNGSSWSIVGTGTEMFKAVGVNPTTSTIVAVGYEGKSAYSTDGTTWNNVQIGPSINNNPDFVCYGNGMWVSGGFRYVVNTSSNGSTWTSQTLSSTSSYTSANYANGQWVVTSSSGEIFTSTDAVSWTLRTTVAGAYLDNSIYANGQWKVFGDSGRVLTSIDNGVTWTSSTAGTATLYDQMYNNGTWVAVGSNGAIYTFRE